MMSRLRVVLSAAAAVVFALPIAGRAGGESKIQIVRGQTGSPLAAAPLALPSPGLLAPLNAPLLGASLSPALLTPGIPAVEAQAARLEAGVNAVAASPAAPRAGVVAALARGFENLAAAPLPPERRAEMRGYHQRAAIWLGKEEGDNSQALADRLEKVRLAWDGARRLEGSSIDEAAPAPGAGKVLLLLAHPDDETMLGGALGRLKKRGADVRAVYLTRGEGGIDFGWQDDVRGHAGLRGLDMDNRGVAALGAGHDLLEIAPRRNLAQARGSEMDEAARRYGLHERLQMAEPDLRGVVRWDMQKAAEAITAFANRMLPDVIITMLPDNLKVHVHHQAVGSLSRDLHSAGKLGTAELFAVEENDWYLPGTFGKRDGKLVVPRGRYADFQGWGAQAHQSQIPGRLGLTPGDESFVPLAPAQGDPKRSRLSRMLEEK